MKNDANTPAFDIWSLGAIDYKLFATKPFNEK